MMNDVVIRLKEFMETEARSGSMDFGCVTPLYVYRAWGGTGWQGDRSWHEKSTVTLFQLIA